jgi:hypothetical protein
VKQARENRAEVPKRRNRRAASSAQIGGSMEDLGEASQDSNHSHLDHAGEQRNEQQRPPEVRPNFNAEQVTWYCFSKINSTISRQCIPMLIQILNNSN